MKKRIKISYFSHAFMMLAFMGAVSACVNDDYVVDEVIKTKANKEGLTISPAVSESSLVIANTRDGAEEPDLKEKDLNTLDVFVEGVDVTFWKQYHLPFPNGKSVQEAVDNFLANSWRQEGLKVGKKYNIYVAANNPKTKDNIASVTALKELVYNEVTEGIAIVNEDNNNITWGKTTTSGNIYKLYNATPGDYRALTAEKEFMMDGVTKNWTPDANSQSQRFNVELKRAAAKIVLNVKFDQTFLDMLKYRYDEDKYKADGTIEWVDAEGDPIAEGGQKVEKPTAEQVTIEGSPAWKFYNFAFGAPVFAPDTAPTSGVEVHNSDFNIFHNKSYTGDDKYFQIVTYSYPNAWAAENYATQAPSLVVSVGYNENGVTNYHYYRIPLVKSTVTSLERNTIYVINATIATRGSETHEDVTPIEDLTYAVLPWNDETNSAAMSSEVESVQHYYFKVNPKVYTLRGDGDQSVVLNYLKASGTKVDWKIFTYNEDGNQTGVVAKDSEKTNNTATRAWFYDADGEFTINYNDNSGTDWSRNGNTPMGVKIEQSNEGTSGSSGKITITSTALNNKGIKYIRLRVYLDENETFDDNGNETMYEDIIIRHFPTDNIQNIPGKWSSYYDKDAGASTTIYKTRDLAEAQALAEQYGITYTTEEYTETEVINYTTYSAHSSESGYSIEGPETRTMDQFASALTSNDNRRDANSQANAILSDGWYYWGENPQQVQVGWPTYDDYDYHRGDYGNRTYYAYQTRYRARYTHTYTYNQYTLELPIPSTGEWVDWDAEDAANHTGQRTYQYSHSNEYGGGWSQAANLFPAKVYNNETIYLINDNRIGNWGNNYQTVLGRATDLTNNHMYVIQISSTSDDYVLGRPYVNQSTHQSQDNVVSPAFMIASQLGAVTNFNSATYAANHCSRYMEVTPDGYRYTGWRLPTPAEIRVITGYQYGNIGGVTIPSQYQVLTPVLTGRYYWSLSGELILTRDSNPSGNYLRCVRDLSADEVERLNAFDKIQEKYQ